MMDRIDKLNEYCKPGFAAHSDGSCFDFSNMVNYEFKRVGGGRKLIHAEWDEEYISNMNDDDFNNVLDFLDQTTRLLKMYSHMSFFEFFDSLK